MSLFELKRVAILPVGAFGVLLHDGVPFAVTLERSYDDGDPDGKQIVKITTGVHKCTRTWFNRGGYFSYEIEQEGHSRILVHMGNVETDSEGCLLLGESFIVLNGAPGIGASGTAFAEFMQKADGVESFELEVS